MTSTSFDMKSANEFGEFVEPDPTGGHGTNGTKLTMMTVSQILAHSGQPGRYPAEQWLRRERCSVRVLRPAGYR